jgi:hypothetical protein
MILFTPVQVSGNAINTTEYGIPIIFCFNGVSKNPDKEYWI